ncbi:MAG: Ribosomal large subunit pseudouridine synthase B [Chlamydiae bacterium]|nr:Ribosomal large subunit pseudouridine synthase B [Chlamydiota bacterium]
MTKNRLSKVLAANGVASRRKCEELIFEGKVTVNGEVILKPQHMVDISKDKISLDGEKVLKTDEKVYYILNKPKGYVCSNDKERFKNIVVDLFPSKHRLFTVGRLDKNTTGLVIVTNDGQLSHRVIHPSFEISKEYLVKTNVEVTAEQLEKISSGVSIERCFVKPQKVTKVRKNTLKIIIQEGKKHEVRELVEQTGLQVQELCRIRIGNLRLGHLEIGHFKKVSLKDLDPVFDGKIG